MFDQCRNEYPVSRIKYLMAITIIAKLTRVATITKLTSQTVSAEVAIVTGLTILTFFGLNSRNFVEFVDNMGLIHIINLKI